MKIIYFYQYFSTPKGSYGTRVYDFAKNWVEKGHDVTIITSIYAKSDIIANKFIDEQVYDGIKVKIINLNIDNKHGIGKRLWTWFVFMFFSCWYALTMKADIVISSSGPITVGVSGLVAKYIRRRKFVFEVRDIWPQGAIEMGLLPNKTVRKMAYWFEKRCYRAADCIVALSPGMVNDIVSRIDIKKIISVTNSANIPLFATKSTVDIGIWKDRKYAIYNGNIGAVNNSEWLFDATVYLKELGREDIYILLIGDGQMRVKLEIEAKKMELSNFVILGLMPKTDLVAYIQNAMVSLVPLKGTPILDSSSPNKFFESLAAGIPVIQNTNGWMKEYLDVNNVGFTVDPDDAMGLAKLLIELSSDDITLNDMGYGAKRLAQRDFDKDLLAQKMLNAMKEIL